MLYFAAVVLPSFYQWIGHPIANDPCYGGELHFGDPEAKRRSDEDTSTRGWKGTSRDRAQIEAASAAASASASAASAAGAQPATAKGAPNEEALKAGGEGATIEGNRDRDGDGKADGSQHQTPETTSNVIGGRSGARGEEAASIGESAGEEVAGNIEAQRDGEDDDAFMVSCYFLKHTSKKYVKKKGLTK